jgi:hypothetical protein
VSFVAIILCVASQGVFIVVSVYFVIDSVRKLLDTPSYIKRLETCSLFLNFNLDFVIYRTFGTSRLCS